MSETIRYKCALIVVSDMERSRHFYENVLGQKVILDYGENITFQGSFSLHLKSHYQSLIDDRDVSTGGHAFELYFEYDNMEEIAGRLKKAGVSFVHEMREQPWRQRVVRFYDPDKHIIEIGESLEYLSFRLHKDGIAVDEIVRIIMMPEVFVKDAIEKYSKNC